jgi:uncharacterized protein YjbJ (UPF0337 family)
MQGKPNLLTGHRPFPVCASRQKLSAIEGIFADGSDGESTASLHVNFIVMNRETIMNRNQKKGRIEAAKGKAQETIGQVKGDKNLERKGQLQKDLGRAQAAYGTLQENIKHTGPRR